MSTMSLRLRNDIGEIQRLSNEIEAFSHAHRLSTKTCFQLNLVLEELVSNTILYGFSDANAGNIDIDIALDKGTLVIQYRDNAPPFNPLDAPAPDIESNIDARSVGGLGIHLVKTLSTDVRYLRDPNGNVLDITLPV